MADNKGGASPTVERVNFAYLLLPVTAVECALLCLQKVHWPAQHPSIFLFIFLIDWWMEMICDFCSDESVATEPETRRRFASAAKCLVDTNRARSVTTQHDLISPSSALISVLWCRFAAASSVRYRDGIFFFLDKNVSLYLAIISLCASAKLSAMTAKEKKKNTSKLSTLSSDSFLIHLKFGVYLTQVGGG